MGLVAFSLCEKTAHHLHQSLALAVVVRMIAISNKGAMIAR